MPPKKAGVYLADYADCTAYLETVIDNLNALKKNLAYEPFDGLSAQFFQDLRKEGESKEAEKIVRGLFAVMDAVEQRKEWRVGRNGLETALLDIWGQIRGAPTAQLILGQNYNVARPAYYTVGMNADENEMRASANFGLAHTPYLKLKVDRNVEYWRSWLPKLHAYCSEIQNTKDKLLWPVLAPSNLGYASPSQKHAAQQSTPIPFVWSIDANSDWDPETARQFLPVLLPYRNIISMVEQPFPVDVSDEKVKEQWKAIKSEYGVHGFAVFADESVSTAADVEPLAEISHGINIKLDKTGGIREALKTWTAANERGLGVWIGIMVSSRLSTSIAACILPLSTLGGDLDGQLLVDVKSDKFNKGLNWDIKTGLCSPPPGNGLGLELKR